jgi:pyroglutamyl-peptidase
MHILLYGFGPYRQFQHNVTERILRKIPNRRDLTKLVFPVKFNRSQFTRAVIQHTPQRILGLGQCPRGRRLRVETRALNRRRNSKKEKARPILRRGAPMLFTDLNLDLGPNARRSRNAGDYVCNFSMYVILECVRRRRLAVPCGFVHVPRSYDAAKAAKLIGKALAKMA